MSEYIQENRRAVIMLVVALCIAMLGGLYLLLSRGTEEELPPVTRGQTQQPAQPVAQAEQSEAVITTAVVRGTGGDPFGPLSGSEEDVAEEEESEPAKQTTDDEPTPNKATSSSTGSTTSKPTDVSGTQDHDNSSPAPEKDVVPEPITRVDESVSVRVLEIDDEYVVVKVEGDRAKLYLSVPGAQDVVYHARLGSDCAWLGRVGSDVRVSVCRGTTEDL